MRYFKVKDNTFNSDITKLNDRKRYHMLRILLLVGLESRLQLLDRIKYKGNNPE